MAEISEQIIVAACKKKDYAPASATALNVPKGNTLGALFVLRRSKRVNGIAAHNTEMNPDYTHFGCFFVGCFEFVLPRRVNCLNLTDNRALANIERGYRAATGDVWRSQHDLEKSLSNCRCGNHAPIGPAFLSSTLGLVQGSGGHHGIRRAG